MERSAHLHRCRGPVVALAAGILAFALTACGEDDPGADEDVVAPSSEQATGEPVAETSDDASAQPDSTDNTDSTDSTGGAATDAGAASGPLTVENLADRCEELKPIVTTLRGEAPLEVDPSAVTGASYNGVKARTSHCDYAYADDSFSDPNRVSIYAETYADAATARQRWDEISASERVPGIGDDASWFFQDTFDAKSSARALVGTTIISVRITVPRDQAGAAYLKKSVAVTALKAVVAKL